MLPGNSEKTFATMQFVGGQHCQTHKCVPKAALKLSFLTHLCLLLTLNMIVYRLFTTVYSREERGGHKEDVAHQYSGQVAAKASQFHRDDQPSKLVSASVKTSSSNL